MEGELVSDPVSMMVNPTIPNSKLLNKTVKKSSRPVDIPHQNPLPHPLLRNNAPKTTKPRASPTKPPTITLTEVMRFNIRRSTISVFHHRDVIYFDTVGIRSCLSNQQAFAHSTILVNYGEDHIVIRDGVQNHVHVYSESSLQSLLERNRIDGELYNNIKYEIVPQALRKITMLAMDKLDKCVIDLYARDAILADKFNALLDEINKMKK